jgi:hypothetical protein
MDYCAASDPRVDPAVFKITQYRQAGAGDGVVDTTSIVKSADSDEVARAYRDDVARDSDMMSPRARCLAGG